MKRRVPLKLGRGRSPLLTLLSLSRELAAASSEEELATAVSRVLQVRFPGRSFSVRLVDPKSLALTSLYAHGRLKPAAGERIALRRAALKRMRLAEDLLVAGGVTVTDEDEPIFEGCEVATAIPLVVAGVLFGVLNLEAERAKSRGFQKDEPWLLQVANQAALCARNLRSIEELRFLKGYLEDLIENANALIVVANRDREVVVFNRAFARLTGFEKEQVLGEDALTLVSDSDRERTARAISKTLAGETLNGFETRMAIRKGSEARVSINTAPIYGSEGEIEGLIAIGQDLTLLREMEGRAEHAQKLAGFGRLAAEIVHEINNPLTTITAYSENLLAKLRAADHSPGDLDKLRRIQEAGQRILRLSRNLIAYARPSTDKTESVDLASLMEQAATMCEPALKEARARIDRRFDPVPAIMANRESLLQVFVNLITNAAHALRPGGSVILEIRAAEDGVLARVVDDGCGMTDEVKARAFEPFFTTKTDGRGSGLGLSIVQGIVARHAGAILVDSKEGAGTSFSITLPCRSPEA